MKKSSRKSQEARVRAIIREVKKDSLHQQKTASLLDELVALQKQLDVEPTELHVAESEVVATYNFGAFSLIRCKTCIIFKTTGYRVVVKPIYTANEDGGVLYSQMAALCEMKEKYDSVTKEEQELWNLVFNLSINILTLPLDAFADDEFLFEVGKFIVEKKRELYEKYIKKSENLKDETAEDEIKNDEFRQGIELAEEMKREADNA